MRSDKTKPASSYAVVEKLKEVVSNPSIIEEFNRGRHLDDQVDNEVDYLADFFGVSYRTIYRRLKAASVSIASLKETVGLDVEAVVDTYDLLEFNPKVVEVPAYWLKEREEITKENTVILGISDIQYGALYNANGSVDNPWEYSSKFFQRLTKEMTKKITRDAPEEIVIALIGDLVDGENIYLGQRVIPVYEQVKAVVELLYMTVTTAASLAPDAYIRVESVRGNHGRITKFHQQSSNWDSVVAYVLSQRFEVHHMHDSYLNVHVNLSTGLYHSFITTDGWEFVLTHGDVVRGVFSGSSSAFNSRPIEQHMEKMKLTHFPNMDALLLGHWHRFHTGELLGMQYVVNGTCYESDFVQTTLMSKESMVFTYIKTSKRRAIDTVELISLD